MLREAFEPFVLCVSNRAEPVLLSDSISEDDLKRFPLFSALAVLKDAVSNDSTAPTLFANGLGRRAGL